ncbi:MAG: hypothetical protein PHO37_13950 [Kiritimatiellae bacterium]|nr:hypothetical protein [Kiritimatiellia bacterium]
MKMKTLIRAAAVMVAISGTAALAEGPQGWKFEIAPYAWLSGIEGDAKVRGHRVDFDKSFSDIIDYVEMAGSLHTVIQYDRYLLWAQMDYFSMSTDKLDVNDQPRAGSLDSKMLFGQWALGYQLDGWMEGQTFDLLAGVRTLSVRNDLRLRGRVRRTFSKDNDLVDPVIVVRCGTPILPSKIKGLSFDPIFGIGAGGDSDLVYELFPQLQYQITELIDVRLGYRVVGYRFKGRKDNELNVNLVGVIAGVGVTF